ncbi:MAG: DUF3291 domain-containing protein [Pseudomonadota bacterium]
MPVAELNIGRVRYDVDDPRMAGFVENLDRVNALAERAEGFVWRYQDASGAAIETSRNGDPRELLNLSVWQTMEDLERYVFGTLHVQFYRLKANWFETVPAPHFVMWPVAEGHLPTIEEALDRLDELKCTGPSDRVFGWEALPNAALWMKKRCA